MKRYATRAINTADLLLEQGVLHHLRAHQHLTQSSPDDQLAKFSLRATALALATVRAEGNAPNVDQFYEALDTIDGAADAALAEAGGNRGTAIAAQQKGLTSAIHLLPLTARAEIH